MKHLMILAMLMLAPAASAALIGFDDGATPQTGLLTYDGVGGGATGIDITLDTILGTDTPANDGGILGCRSCLLNFTTGANVTEGGAVWEWLPGGTFSITGTAFDGGGVIASGTLLSGTFGTNSLSLGGGANQLFAGVGFDTKHPDLVSYYGFPANQQFAFATTNLSLGGCTLQANAGFDCNVSNADVNNLARVPIPSTALLFGLGMAGLMVRRNLAS